MSDDQAPRWLVRWLKTALLVVALAGVCFWIYWEATANQRAADKQIEKGCEASARAGYPCP